MDDVPQTCSSSLPLPGTAYCNRRTNLVSIARTASLKEIKLQYWYGFSMFVPAVRAGTCHSSSRRQRARGRAPTTALVGSDQRGLQETTNLGRPRSKTARRTGARHCRAEICYLPRSRLPIGNNMARRQIALQRQTPVQGGLKTSCRIVLAAATLALFSTATTRLCAIETSYGEDPVPDAHRFNGSICLGYGVDPIPVRSPLERWTFWRSERGRAAHAKSPARGQAPPASANSPALTTPTTEHPQSPWWRFGRQATRPARTSQ
jgi:hypothetical protein